MVASGLVGHGTGNMRDEFEDEEPRVVVVLVDVLGRAPARGAPGVRTDSGVQLGEPGQGTDARHEQISGRCRR